MLPMLLFGCLGAITWAIRGTSGWGGIDGTLVPGLTWGLLWYYLCWRKGLDARGIVLWLGLGLGLGGELGYGQYVSWIRGSFETASGPLPVSPWTGYLWFTVCGIGWAAPGGILLGWALHAGVSPGKWTVRVLLLLALLVILFDAPLPGLDAGAVSWTGTQLARTAPGLLFPLADTSLYVGELDRHLIRTVYTNTQNAGALVWWLCALLLAVLQRDRATLVCGAVLGAGFGVGFALSAAWCLGYGIAPAYIDWWKMWELHAGFNLGVLYALLWYWVVRRAVKSMPEGTSPPPVSFNVSQEWFATFFMAFSGFLLVFAAGAEYFFWTGLLLALFYALSLIILAMPGGTKGGGPSATELRKRVSFIYSAFLLVFILIHGATSRLGVFLECYSPSEVDQYAWPFARIALFLPPALLVTIVTLYCLVRARFVSEKQCSAEQYLAGRMIDLFAFIALVGALSIWPEKIGVLYALFLMVALFAFTRINRRFDGINAGRG